MAIRQTLLARCAKASRDEASAVPAHSKTKRRLEQIVIDTLARS